MLASICQRQVRAFRDGFPAGRRYLDDFHSSKTTNLNIDLVIMQIFSKVSSDAHLCNLALEVTSCPELETIYVGE